MLKTNSRGLGLSSRWAAYSCPEWMRSAPYKTGIQTEALLAYKLILAIG